VPYAYSKDELNAEFVRRAEVLLTSGGFHVETSIAHRDYDVNAEIDKIIKADLVIFQFPLYNMSVPWALKNIWMMCF
jgi:modulator of drug activity B